MKREKRQQLAHLVAGAVTLVYGFGTFEKGDFSLASYYLTAAIIFMIVAGSHKWIVKKFMSADVAFFLIESATILYVALHYKASGYVYLSYAISLIGLLYFVFATITLFLKEKPRHRSKHRRRRTHSSLFDEEKRHDDNESQ